MGLTDKIRDAGVVGCGGAGFPTHVKLNASPEVFIVNAAECEPLLRTDRYLMLHRPEDLVRGVELICGELKTKDGVIALKKTYDREIEELLNAIKKLDSRVRLHLMDSFYPAGDEQVVVYEVTGKVVPPSGIPLNVGVVVDNVATVIAVYDAEMGIPFTAKYLTVTGEVREPSVMKVPVGTSFAKCLEMAGGPVTGDVMIVSGGPMMGRAMTYKEAMESFVTKTTSGILVLPEGGAIDRRMKTDIRHTINRVRSACIQCSFCTDLCPRHMLGHPLRPHMIMRKMAMAGDLYDAITGKAAADGISTGENAEYPEGSLRELYNDYDIRQAAICSECGVCEVYACPMGLQPRTVNALLKKELAGAGIRYEKEDREYTASPFREIRKPPTGRIAARAGVGDYYHIEGHVYKEDMSPGRVELSLRMHIGTPSVPVINEGEYVKRGQLIAKIPDGSLGANIHASIDGTAHIKADSIVIE